MILLGLSLLVRLCFAGGVGLGVDESYMVAAGRTLQWGYYDHPPIAWWLAWGAAHLAGSDAALVVRLPFLLLFSLSTWLMFRLAADMYGAAAGFWSALLFNLMPVMSVTTGCWVLPDGPLVACLLGGTLCLWRALTRLDGENWGWWLGAGACLGLALDCKYTAILPASGAALFLLTQRAGRFRLAWRQILAAGLLALALFSPVLIWNAAHGFISFLFQGGRAVGGKWHFWAPLATLGGEAIFGLPWVWVPLMLCLGRATRSGHSASAAWLMVCLSLPSLVFFDLVSLRAHVMFHWAAPATILAVPLLGAEIARRAPYQPRLRGWLRGTAIAVVAGVLLVICDVRFNLVPDRLEQFGKAGPPELALIDWTSASSEMARRGLLRPGIVVAGTRWNDAGKIDYALHGQVPVICLGGYIKQYGLSSPAARYAGSDVIMVAPRDTLASITERFGDEFDGISMLPPVWVVHAGHPAMSLALFLGHRLHPIQ